MTPAADELFRRCQEIVASGKADTFEQNGGRHREYLDAIVELQRLLGFKPWDPDVLDAADPVAAGLGERERAERLAEGARVVRRVSVEMPRSRQQLIAEDIIARWPSAGRSPLS